MAVNDAINHNTFMKAFVVLLTLALLSACSSKPYVVKPTDGAVSTRGSEIYIVSHGWHTGFVIPSDALTERLPKLKNRFKNSPNLEIGWGDKGFYQAKEITSGLTMRAIFMPTESVVHVVAVPKDVIKYFPHSKVETLCLNGPEFDSLVRFIESSFARDSNGNIVPLKNGIYGDSQFYQGVGDYYLMNTCNKWTAKGLSSAGLDISPTFKLTAGSVMSYLNSSESARSVTVKEQGSCSLPQETHKTTAVAYPVH